MFRNPLIDGVVILVIVLLIMGPKRLPELGKGLGRGMREFKEGITGEDKDDGQGRAAPRAVRAGRAAAAEPSSAERRDSAEVGSDAQGLMRGRPPLATEPHRG